MMRKSIFLIALLCGLSVTSMGQKRFSEREAIARAQTTIVHRFDAKLSNQRFDVWLANLLGKDTKIAWSLHDCGETTGTAADRARDMPICAGVDAYFPDGRRLLLYIIAGSQRRELIKISENIYFGLIKCQMEKRFLSITYMNCQGS